MIAPEAESARRTSWGNGFRHVVAQPLPYTVDERISIDKGGRERVLGSFRFASPGFYRIVVSASAPDAPYTTSEGQLIQNVTHQELWILVEETGGGVFRRFDPDVVPDSALPGPGPFRYRGQPTDNAAFPAQVQQCNPRGGCRISLQVLYFDADSAANVPLPHAKVAVTYQDLEMNGQYEQVVVYSDYFLTYAESDGRIWYDDDCMVNDVWDEAVVQAWATTPEATVIGEYPTRRTKIYPKWESPYAHCLPPGLQIMLPSDASRAVRSATAAHRGATSFFGLSIPRVTVDLKDGNNDLDAPFYDMYRGHIEIIQPDVWGSAGETTISHEFGHAYHHLGIGGLGEVYPVDYFEHWTLVGVEISCLHHTFWGPESRECALMEGIAQFVGVASIGSRSVRYNQVTDGYASSVSPQQEGWKIEGSIANFLWDLADPGTDAVDQIGIGGAAVIQALGACEDNFGEGDHISAIHPFVYCLEQEGYGGDWIAPYDSWNVDYSQIGTFPASAAVHDLAAFHLMAE